MNENNQERLYSGLLGLDRLHPAIKALNFVVIVIIGTNIAWDAWYRPMVDNRVLYDLMPFSWPLIFLFAWPLCAVTLWLRFTGLKWRWGLLAGILILIEF